MSIVIIKLETGGTLLDAVKNYKIVLLGEFNHGSKEIFLTRNELVKELHRKLDFDVILFESGIGEVGAIGIERELLSKEQMTNGFFGRLED